MDQRRSEPLPEVVVANLHRRYTGVSATVAALVPVQRRGRALAVVDSGGLGLPGTWPLARIAAQGWQRPPSGGPRVWHARRDTEMLAGLFLRDALRQPWRLVFTSAAPRRHGRVLRGIMGRMDAIIATSDRAAGFLDWHSAVVPHGVDTDLFRPPADREAAKAEVGLKGQRLIGVFGRLRPSKGTDLVVDALLHLLPERAGWTAVFTGLATPAEAGYANALRDRVRHAGLGARIRFLGDLPMAEVRRWYQRIDLCVAASRQEGFGLTPLEAFASGAPAITSGAGAWPTVIDAETGGEVGWRFETGSVESLTSVLGSALDLPAEALCAMGQRARARAVARHSIDAEARGIEAVYKALLSGSALPRQGRV